MNPPAFQLYADDLIAGTVDLSQAELGAYLRLLCAQWSKGGLPDDMTKLERIAGGPVTEDVLAKLPLCEDGKRRNKRMEVERDKQAAYRQEQAEKGRAGAAARWHRHSPGNGTGNATAIAQALPKPMAQASFCQWPGDGSPSPSPSPDSSLPERESPKPTKKPQEVIPPTLEDVRAKMIEVGLTAEDGDRFFHCHERKGWMINGRKMKNWHSAINYWKSNERKNQRATSGPTARLSCGELWEQANPKSELAKDNLFPCA